MIVNFLSFSLVISAVHIQIGLTSNLSGAPTTILRSRQKFFGNESVPVRIHLDDGKDSPNSTSSSPSKKILKIFRRKPSSGNVEQIKLPNFDGVVKSALVPIQSSIPPKGILEKHFNASNEHDRKEGNRASPREILPADEHPIINPDELQARKNDLVGSRNESLQIPNQRKWSEEIEKVERSDGKGERVSRGLKRLINLIPTWLSVYPINWTTKRKITEEADAEERIGNLPFWSKLNLFPSKTPKIRLQSSGKIKKLLNLFTIVKFDNRQCQVDNLIGICLHETECENKGGKFIGMCAMNFGVCCYVEKTCGESSNETLTYFVNEGFPQPSTAAPKVCTLTLDKVSPDVGQLRMEFLNFQLRDPANGICLRDRMVITGQNVNNVIPDICGSNTGQHIYVDVDDSDGPYKLNIVMMGEYYPRNFRIQITQLKSDDELLSPKNCLQYYAEPKGIVQSFNYKRNSGEKTNQVSPGYFNNLNYAICIKKVKGFCSISYENKEENGAKPTFQMINVDREGEKLSPPMQAGSETFDCPDDYIIVGGIRLCGEKLNDGFVEVDLAKNYPVMDTSNGPFVLYVRTDAAETGRGFNLTYKQNPCSV